MILKTGILPYNLQLEDGERLGALDDPPPIPDGMLQNPYIHYAYDAFLAYSQRHEGVFMDTNTFVYYDRRDRNRRLAPDIYLALGVDVEAIRRRNGYLIWEVGKPPDFVLEVASESTARRDLDAKRSLYLDMVGAVENWRFDSTGGEYYGEPLVGELLAEPTGAYGSREYRRLPSYESAGGLWVHSPTLNIDIGWVDGELRIYDPQTGETFREYLEYLDLEKDYLESERGRVQAEQDRIQAERNRIQAERGRRESEMRRSEAETRGLQERQARLAAEANLQEARSEVRRLRERLRQLGG